MSVTLTGNQIHSPGTGKLPICHAACSISIGKNTDSSTVIAIGDRGTAHCQAFVTNRIRQIAESNAAFRLAAIVTAVDIRNSARGRGIHNKPITRPLTFTHSGATFIQQIINGPELLDFIIFGSSSVTSILCCVPFQRNHLTGGSGYNFILV